MRAAHLIVPTGVGPSVRQEVERRIMREFGGYTKAVGEGAWVDPTGQAIVEPVMIFTVAVAETVASEAALLDVAEYVRAAGQQQSVYVELPGGQVRFHEAPQPARAPAKAA